MHSDPVEENLKQHFAALSPQLQRAARYVLDHPEDVATRSLRQVADRGGMNPPVLSRLARAVGYPNYEALRDGCRDRLRQERLTLAERAALMKPAGPAPGTFALRHARAAATNIQTLADGLDPERLAGAADCLVAARNVWVIGSQSSGAMANYMGHMASLAAPNWAVAGTGTSSAAAALAGVTRNDAVLAISVAPYLRKTLDLTRFAARRGAKIIVVTDDIDAPILQAGDFSFLAATESPQFFPSHAALLVLLEILMGMVVRRLGPQAEARIAQVEKFNSQTGDYV